MATETQGSQWLLRKAVNQTPEVLLSALRDSGALGKREKVVWHSPLLAESHREYRDGAAVRALGLETRIISPLTRFWPARGPAFLDARQLTDPSA